VIASTLHFAHGLRAVRTIEIAIPEFAPSTDSTFSMLHGLYWLLNNLARDAPVALCVDDLHWSDGESLKFFNYLASRLDGVPLALFASVRTRETFPADLVRLCEGPETKLVRLAPLTGPRAGCRTCVWVALTSPTPDPAKVRDQNQGAPRRGHPPVRA